MSDNHVLALLPVYFYSLDLAADIQVSSRTPFPRGGLSICPKLQASKAPSMAATQSRNRRIWLQSAAPEKLLQVKWVCLGKTTSIVAASLSGQQKLMKTGLATKTILVEPKSFLESQPSHIFFTYKRRLVGRIAFILQWGITYFFVSGTSVPTTTTLELWNV